VTVEQTNDGLVEVLDPGLLALVEDLGRPGHAHLGIGRSGAADLPSLRLGNRLVGNRPGAAGLELTLGGARFRFHRAAVVALTGAEAPADVDGARVEFGRAVPVPAGATLRIRRPARGVRAYLAVRGGIAVPAVLGSRSRDTLAGLGPAPLVRGDLLPVGSDVDGAGAPPGLNGQVAGGGEVLLRVRPGPRDDWFEPSALDTLFGSVYAVTPQSDRVGMRLSGERLVHRARAELPPEGMVTGAIEVPPSGQPVLFLADHPLTGGYPVIGVVTAEGVARAAQIRPGGRIRFAPDRR
jgi:biotin-dependent carboxylase-like uncharacterized protein